jgi:Protein of unknown function (DUF2442)
MLEITAVETLVGRSVRLTLSDGSTVERDLTDLLRGPLFNPIAADDELFSAVRVEYGTLVWPGGIDIAPETLIWDGPNPDGGTAARPAAHLRPKQPV